MNLVQYLNESLTKNLHEFDGLGNSNFTDQINEAKSNGLTISDINKMSSLEEFYTLKTDLKYILGETRPDGTFGYDIDNKLSIIKYRGSVEFLELKDAMKKGGKGGKFTIYSSIDDSGFDFNIEKICRGIIEFVGGKDAVKSNRKVLTLEILNAIIKLYSNDDKKIPFDKNYNVIDLFKNPQASKDIYCMINIDFETVSVSKVYSPFALETIKPIKELPKKWKTNDVIRAISNSQYTYLGRNYRFSDDYAFDAASNYSKTDSLNPLVLIKELANANRYTIYVDDQDKRNEDGKVAVVKVSSHSESFTMVFDINGLSKKEVIKKHGY